MKQVTLLLLLFSCGISWAQPSFTANDVVPSFDTPFRVGVNPGYHSSAWSDDKLADIAAGNPDLGIAGAGIKAFRASLPEEFVLEWGFDVRIDEFEHYANLGMDEHTVFLQDPSDEHLDLVPHCPDEPSKLFANMYLPIWDDGSDGTPINDDNYAAAYVYHVVNTYKDYVKFWEIYNEPDFDYSNNGWRDYGDPGNWYENVPDPCDYKLRAPVYHYIRMLRIAYEVTKTVDPDAYVAVGGLGHISFLDIILRFTDNPAEGQITSEFPLKGGAYFDCMSYHCYPHIDGGLRYWDSNINAFAYKRHSDAAVEEVYHHKDEFEELLETYGYDGVTYPRKVFINTESNIPRKQFDEQFGNEEAQRNFGIKVQVEAYKNDLRQLHFFNLADKHTFEDATSWTKITGLYEKIADIQPYNVTINEEGIGSRTTMQLLWERSYDAAATAALNLPDNIKGGVFMDADNNPLYVLWAVTDIDLSELAFADYSFSSSLNYESVQVRYWNYGETGYIADVSPENVSLSGAPVFITGTIGAGGSAPVAAFSSNFSSNCSPATVQFTDESTFEPSSYSWTFLGANPSSSTEANPSVVYAESGTYQASLTVQNAFGTSTETLDFIIHPNEETTLNITINEGESYMVGNSVYTMSGEYTDVLQTQFGCDSTVFLNLTVLPLIEAPIAAFSTEIEGACTDITVHFTNESTNEPTDYYWEFPGGNPSTSTAENPSVFYAEGGVYEATLTVQNTAGASSEVFSFYLPAHVTTSIVWEMVEGESYMVGNSIYTMTGEYTDVLQTQFGCDSIVHLDLTVYEEQQPPTANFTTNFMDDCSPVTIDFTDQSTFEPTNYSWEFPGGNPDASVLANPSVLYATGGTYEVLLTVQNDVGSDTQNLFLTIPDAEEITIEESINEGESYTVGTSVYTMTGSYVDTLQTQFGCDSIVFLNLTVLTNIFAPTANELAIKVIPNPTNEQAYIQLHLMTATDLSVQFYDIQGKIIDNISQELSLNSGQHLIPFSLETVASGIYFIQVETEHGDLGVSRVVKL